MDFQQFYGMTHNPFEKDSKEVIETIDMKEMTYRLNYLKEVRGIGVFTGRSGVGKTWILHQFIKGLNPNTYKTSLIQLTTVSVSDFYNQLAESLGLEPAFRKAAKFKQIQERIHELYDIERMVPVIVIDEAQYLNGQIFHELLLLLNFDLDTKRNCIVILSGLPTLSNQLNRNSLEAFKQRIVTNYQAVGLDKEEVSHYVCKKLEAAGTSSKLISDGVLPTILSSAGDSIRSLNRLITQCLIIGAMKGELAITNETVESACTELRLS